MEYLDLSVLEGREFMPFVLNLVFKPVEKDQFFVEPWKNTEIRDCADFRMATGKYVPDEIWFFVTNRRTVDFLRSQRGELYAFGAYNQVQVIQMRARGTVLEVTSDLELKGMRKMIRTRIAQRVSGTGKALSREDAAARYAIVESGALFCFCISSFAYKCYERG